MVYLLPSSLLQRIFPQLAAAPAESSTTTTSASFRPLTTTTPGSGSSSRSASPASGYGSKTRRSSTDSQLTLWPSSDDHSSKWMPEDPFLEEQRTPRSTSSRRDWRELWRWANSVLRAAIVLMAIHGVWMQAAWHRGSYMPTPHYTRNDIAQAGFIRQPLEFGKLPSGNAVSKETRRTQTSVHDFADLSTAPRTPDEQHVLILSPLRNAEPTLSAFLELLATLEHPRAQTSLGLLIGDEEDATGSLIADWVKEQAEKGEYRHISLIRKDFGLDSPKGNARHLKWVQPQRRCLTALCCSRRRAVADACRPNALQLAHGEGSDAPAHVDAPPRCRLGSLARLGSGIRSAKSRLRPVALRRRWRRRSRSRGHCRDNGDAREPRPAACGRHRSERHEAPQGTL